MFFDAVIAALQGMLYCMGAMIASVGAGYAARQFAGLTAIVVAVSCCCQFAAKAAVIGCYAALVRYSNKLDCSGPSIVTTMSNCYLICSINPEDDLAFHVKDWAATFRPSSVTAQVIPGWGNLRLHILGSEVSLADEPPGIQVCFESGGIPAQKAQQIVQEMCDSAARITQVPSRVIAG